MDGFLHDVLHCRRGAKIVRVCDVMNVQVLVLYNVNGGARAGLQLHLPTYLRTAFRM